MTKAFNLLRENWVPVRLQNGKARHVGLEELFERSGDIATLAETSPPSLVALHRLLLAIVHRAFTRHVGRWTDQDRVNWYRDGLPWQAIRDYLEQWQERFWLFHPDYPFMQVPALATADETRDRVKPWTQISLSSATGNTPVIFDHATDDNPPAMQPDLALRHLLGFLQFSPGGLVKVLRDSDKAGPLANTAAMVPTGESLNQTLCLALHLPTPAGHQDLPCWECTPPGIADLSGPPQFATGPNDRYTRLTRAVLFHHGNDGAIHHLHFAAGLSLADDPNAPDPMASYKYATRKKGYDEKGSLQRITFNRGRALWRDLPALVPDPDGAASQPAAVLGYAANLHAARTLHALQEQPILVAGIASEPKKPAKLARWRAEQIQLPAALLGDAAKSAVLREMIAESENLFDRFSAIACRLIELAMPASDSKETEKAAGSIFAQGPCTAAYFSHAERAVGQLMRLIAEERDGEAENLWRTTLVEAAKQAWSALGNTLGASPRVWRADAQQWPRFHHLLRQWAPQPASAHSVTAREDTAS